MRRPDRPRPSVRHRRFERQAPQQDRIVGVFAREGDGGGILTPTDRRDRRNYRIRPRDALDSPDGALVVAERLETHPAQPPRARILEALGRLDDPLAPSLVAIREQGIPVAFSAEALAEAEAAEPVPLDGRADLRGLSLITIDGDDARDFDDAVWAEPADQGGWHLVVAIADVSWYVAPGSALDREAAERGNSVYFPDRVVPMLPEALSNELCSLKPGVDRACVAMHLWIDAAGTLLRHETVRGLMRSAARRTYEQVQAEFDAGGNPLLGPLYGAYRSLDRNRRDRGALDLDLPEYRVRLGADGQPVAIDRRQRLDSHRLIEAFMIAANVAAAETLERLNRPCLYRIHDRPDPERLDGLRKLLDGLGAPGVTLARGQVIQPAHFARLLAAAEGRKEAPLIHELVLRSQAQAAYAPRNIGHFGLGLRAYAHFTSPIRRYADLLVHRALLGEIQDHDLARIGRQVTDTERRATRAERDTAARYIARFMRDRIGGTFPARITGIARFGLFVTLNETGADGLVPVGTLPRDDYRHEPGQHTLTGRRTRTRYTLGQPVSVTLVEANPVGAGLVFALAGGARRAERESSALSSP
jgi:ribonuclease R